MRPLILSFILFFFITSHSQDRKNVLTPTFDKKSGILYNATGWYLDEFDSGEWISAYNCIGGSKRRNNNIPIKVSPYNMSLLDDNFISIQFGEFTHDNEIYYILLFDKWEGLFEYPSIGEGWMYYKTKYGYVFSKVEYDKLLKMDNHSILKAYSKIARSGEACITNNILMSLKNDVFTTEFNKNDISNPYYFEILKYNGKIRFQLPNGKYPKEIADELNRYKDDIFKISSNQINDFEKEYFETSLLNFNKLLIK